MSRVPDPALRLRWQRRLRKFQSFPGSVRRFCHAENVSVASFYQWRLKLTDDTDAMAAAQTAAEDINATQFVPLQLVQQTTRHAPPTHAAIVLAGGTRIELPSEDSAVLQAVMRAVAAPTSKACLKTRNASAKADAGAAEVSRGRSTDPSMPTKTERTER